MSPRPPNILVLWTDEQRWDTLGAYGNPRIHTPHLDALAARSVCFERCIVAQPVCTPSRGTIMTGLWPHQHGAVRNNLPLPTDTPVHAEMLPTGYRSAYMGKWHLGDEVFRQHGFDEWVSIEDMYSAHYRDDRDRDAVSSYTHWLRDLGYEPDQKGQRFGRWRTTELPPEHCKPAFLAEQASAFLQRDDERPFLLHVNFLEPHTPLNGPYNGRHAAHEVPVTESWYHEQGPDRPPRYRQREKDYRAADRELRDEAETRRQGQAYYGLVEQVDEAVGRILAALEASGHDRDTLIVFTSDHGNQLGAHGLMYKGVLYEESVRVPLLVRLPGDAHAGSRIPCPVSHIDLAPTLIDYAGSPPRADLPGRSWRDLIEGDAQDHGPVISEWNPGADGMGGPGTEPDLHTCQRMILTPDRWKLVLDEQHDGMLFDLVHDPQELRNRFHDPLYREVRYRLAQQLRDWQRATGDSAPLRWPEPIAVSG